MGKLRKSLMKFLLTSLVTAFFATSTAVLAQDATPSEDVVLDERPIARVGARLAYNSQRGPIFGASYTSRKLFGRDAYFRFSAEVSEHDRLIGINFRNDEIFGGSPRSGLRMYHNETRATSSFGFDTAGTGLEPRLSWAFGENTTLTGRFLFSRDSVSNVSATNSALIKADVGKRTRMFLGARLNYGLPGEGKGRIYVSADVAKTSHNTNYLKLLGGISKQRELNNGSIIVSGKLSGGMLQMAGGASSSIGDRFFLGQGSLRGFGFGGFGPRDLNTPNNSPLGGNSFVAWRTDIQMPYLVGEASTVVPGVFLDLGSIWDLNSVAGGANGRQIVDDSLNLRASLGISVQFNTAVGPISVSMAHAAKKERYDQTQTLMFSYNRSF